MDDLNSAKEENIPNTFAPNARNKVFSLNMILTGLKQGFMKYDKLPPDVKKRVSAYTRKYYKGGR